MLSEDQHAARSKGIGGSDLPIILQAVKYKTPVQLWMEKRGVSEPEDISDKINIRMGNKLEPVVVELFEEETGFRTRKVNKTRVHKEHTFMVGNIDRDIVGERAGFEAKAFSPFARDQWGESGTGDVPMSVVAQCAHYMEIWDYDVWYVGVLLGLHDFRWFKLERNPVVTEQIIRIEREFWDCVVTGEVPKMLGDGDIARLYPNSVKPFVRADESITPIVSLLQKKKADLKSLETQIAKYQDHIKQFMTDHGELMPEGSEGVDTKPMITWNKTKDGTKSDWKAAFSDLCEAVLALDIQGIPINIGIAAWEIPLAEVLKGIEATNTKPKPGHRMFLVK